MACAGVVASAGAQIQFALFTVGSYTSGKSTIFGYAPASSAGAMNPTSFGIANGQVHAVFFLDDQGSTIRLGLTDSSEGGAPNSALSFNRLIIDDLVLNRADASNYTDAGSYVQWTFTTSDDAISAANGTTIFAQLRAD